MEIACPRCDTLFSANTGAVQAHRGRVRCGRCHLAFQIPVASYEPISAPPPLPQPKNRRIIILSLIFLLSLALLAEILWWSRGYLAAWPTVRQAIAQFTQDTGLPFTWPQDLSRLRIAASNWQPLSNHSGILAVRLQNRDDFVQTFPRLAIRFTDNQGGTLETRVFTPSEYLAPAASPKLGFSPNSSQDVTLMLEDVPPHSGYQVQLLPD